MLKAIELMRITGGKWLVPLKNKEQILRGAAFDSRKIQKEQIFFCWQGKNNDGHLFLTQLQGTSIEVVIVEKQVSKRFDFAILQVTNSLKALHQIAHFIAKNCQLPILALTGSNGKTTAKSWILHLLLAKYKVLTNYKNFNNHIGCPLTLLNLAKENFILLEIGTSHSGEILHLVDIVEPHYALLLNIGLAHLSGFQTLKKIYQEKTSIFQSKRLKIGFLSSKIKKPQTNQNFIAYGENTPYQCQIIKVDLSQKKSLCQIIFHKKKKILWLPLLAYHVQETIPMLLAVGDYFKIEFSMIIQKITQIKTVPGRMELIAFHNNRWIIDDSYNGNPSSVVHLLQTMSLCKDYQKIAVIGFLAELEVGLEISGKYLKDNMPCEIDKIYFLGQTGRQFVQKLSDLVKPQVFFVEETELLHKLSQEFSKNTLLAFKASRSARLETLIAKAKQIFTYGL